MLKGIVFNILIIQLFYMENDGYFISYFINNQ